jgi:threonylcarbamoyladenosine tRNA methylthiotransferase MtaB
VKYAVVTFGCRVNQADSLGFEEELLASGAVASSPDAADLVVVNTCSVTATADQGARQTIRRIARENPDARIVVTGCYATRKPDDVGALPNVAQVICNDDKPRLVPLLRSSPRFAASASAEASAGAFARADPSSAGFGSGDGPCGAALEPGIAGRTAFTLRVQTGCAEPCSYCIIPSTRGAPRSVPVAGVLREIERVAAAGFKEIALTGVHLGSYGRDLSPRSSLLALLEASATTAAAHQVRLRVSSLEPMDCSRGIVDLVAASDGFAPHFHLPLQHASNRILAAMHRPYTIEYYAALVDDIRARIPDASIGTDVIVGFPGETDADADILATYLERSPVTHIHVFPYSDRPGTPASAMGDRAPGPAIRARARHLREIGARLTARFRASQIGTIHRALTLDDGSVAVTGNYLKVAIAPARARNEWITLRIAAADGGGLRGDVLPTAGGPAATATRAAESSTPVPA